MAFWTHRTSHKEQYIKSLQEENLRLKHELQRNGAYIQQLCYDNKSLERKLKKIEEEKRKMDKSLQKAINDMSHNSTSNVVATLKDDLERVKKERDERDTTIAELNAEIETLTLKMSKVAGDKLLDANPGIADLSDSKRPMKLVEMFSSLYDNKWTDAYEKCEGGDKDEKKIPSYLLDLFKTSWTFCQEIAEKQFEQMEKALLQLQDSKDGITSSLSPSSIRSLKETRRQTSRDFLPNLYQKFKKDKVDVKEDLQQFVEGCLDLCWFSAISDPPLDYGFKADDQMDDFRAFTQSGKKVDFIVWPAMYLCPSGPLLSKGVAQFRE